MSAESKLAGQWVQKALSDLLCADNNLAAKITPYDMVCYHCQQAAEKFLKAFLIRRGCQYPLTHDLLMLLEQILAIDPKAERLRESLLILMPYAVEVRYPDDKWAPDKSDAQEARRSVQEIYDWLRMMHPELFE